MELTLKNMMKFISENHGIIDRIFNLQKDNMRFLNFIILPHFGHSTITSYPLNQ